MGERAGWLEPSGVHLAAATGQPPSMSILAHSGLTAFLPNPNLSYAPALPLGGSPSFQELTGWTVYVAIAQQGSCRTIASKEGRDEEMIRSVKIELEVSWFHLTKLIWNGSKHHGSFAFGRDLM